MKPIWFYSLEFLLLNKEKVTYIVKKMDKYKN